MHSQILDLPVAMSIPSMSIKDPSKTGGDPGQRRVLLRIAMATYATVSGMVEWLFGFFAMIIFLSILATIPIAQLLSLGYLLESGARVGKFGWRQAFPGVRVAARLGGAILCLWLLAQPVRLVTDLRASALLLQNPVSARRLGALSIVLMILLVWHSVWACWRGGRIRSFLWPAPLRFVRTLQAGGWYREARDRLVEMVIQCQLPRLFWLGLRGFAIATIWLFVPISLLILSTRLAGVAGGTCWAIGSAGLFAVLLYLPFAQMNFAESRSFWNGFDVRQVRRQFQRAPWAFLIAALATFVLAIPLYLLKAELLPREAAWLPSTLFVISIWPARLLTGWAIGRANRAPHRPTPLRILVAGFARIQECARKKPKSGDSGYLETTVHHGSKVLNGVAQRRHFVWRWSSFLAMVPLVLAYVGLVYLTQYVSWYGAWSLYEQHAFLLPVPFMGI